VCDGERREGLAGGRIILTSLGAATVGGVLSLFRSIRRAVLVAGQQCETAANTEAGARERRVAILNGEFISRGFLICGFFVIRSRSSHINVISHMIV